MNFKPIGCLLIHSLKETQKKKFPLSRKLSLTNLTDSMDSLSKLWEIVKDRKAWQAAVHEVAKSWEELSG